VLALVVAALAAQRQPPRARSRFISEILAICRRAPRDAPGFWGSVVANVLLFAGAAVFVADALLLDGVQRAFSLATGVTLLAVVAIPLRLVEDARQASGFDLGHPIAAASFYLAALILGAIGLLWTGPIGFALSILHVATSSVLVFLAVYGGYREYGWEWWPPIGTRILLDRAPGALTERVRWFQWPATFAVGVALCVGAMGV
jgi:hypothetical protein